MLFIRLMSAAVEDFHLLVKLSYTLSYTKDDDKALDKAVLLRLILLADAYEFKSCLKQCAEALYTK